MADSVPTEVVNAYAEETDRLLKEAQTKSLTLRLLGAQAIRLRCRTFGYLLDQIGRQYVDIDFVTLGEQRKHLRQFFKLAGYEIDRHVLIAAEGGRYIFQNRMGMIVDVFVDRLDFCHRIELSNRLQFDYPTVPLADLLLSKLQIVHFAEKDFQDTCVLLLEKRIGSGSDAEIINKDYISSILADDWGFYFTVVRNLKQLSASVPTCNWLNTVQKGAILDNINSLTTSTESTKKTFRWKLRSKIGSRIKWYQEVSSRDQVF